MTKTHSQLREDPVLPLLDQIIQKNMVVRHRAFTALLSLSQDNPEQVYPHFDFFSELLLSKNIDLLYVASYVIANLVKVDSANKFEKIFHRYFALLNHPGAIAPAHAALNAAKIVRSKPLLEPQITACMLRIDETSRDRHVELIKAYIIQAFSDYFDAASDKDAIVAFVKDQISSPSPKARKIAKQFLATHHQ